MSLARGAPRRLCVCALVRFCAVQACGAASNHTYASGSGRRQACTLARAHTREWVRLGRPPPALRRCAVGEALPPRIQCRPRTQARQASKKDVFEPKVGEVCVVRAR